MPGLRVQIFGTMATLGAIVSCATARTVPKDAKTSAPTESAAMSEEEALAPATEVREPQEAQEAQATTARPSELAQEESDNAPNASPQPKGTPQEEWMRTHFRDAESIRAALVAGKPEDAVKPAYDLAHLVDIKDLPKEWAEPVERLQTSASRLKDSSDMAQAAAAMADIGTSCGRCHQMHGGPSAVVGTPPSTDGTVPSQMARHAWATERLWQGLYLPSNQAWNTGAKALNDAPFPDEVLTKGGVYARSAAEDFSRIVVGAPLKQSAAERAAIYARLLGTCATCHIAMQ